MHEATEPRSATTAGRRSRHIRTNGLGPGGSAMRIVLLLLIAVFFGLPLIWLLLAPTKTDTQLTDWTPLAFGSFARVALAWKNLTDFSDGIVLRWGLNSIVYT